VQNTDMQNKC